MLKNDNLVVEICVDTAENGPFQSACSSARPEVERACGLSGAEAVCVLVREDRLYAYVVFPAGDASVRWARLEFKLELNSNRPHRKDMKIHIGKNNKKTNHQWKREAINGKR